MRPDVVELERGVEFRAHLDPNVAGLEPQQPKAPVGKGPRSLCGLRIRVEGPRSHRLAQGGEHDCAHDRRAAGVDRAPDQDRVVSPPVSRVLGPRAGAGRAGAHRPGGPRGRPGVGHGLPGPADAGPDLRRGRHIPGLGRGSEGPGGSLGPSAPRRGELALQGSAPDQPGGGEEPGDAERQHRDEEGSTGHRASQAWRGRPRLGRPRADRIPGRDPGPSGGHRVHRGGGRGGQGGGTLRGGCNRAGRAPPRSGCPGGVGRGRRRSGRLRAPACAGPCAGGVWCVRPSATGGRPRPAIRAVRRAARAAPPGPSPACGCRG